MAIRSTSTNIDIGNATTETGTQRPPTVTSIPGKAEALLGLRTRKTSFTLAFDLEPADLTDGLALPTSMLMPTSMSTEMPIDTGPGPTSKESATSGTADRPFPLKNKSPFTATKTSGKVI